MNVTRTQSDCSQRVGRARWAAAIALVIAGCAPPSPVADASETSMPGDASSEAGLTCTPGDNCGNDCTPSDGPCWACGALTYNARCECEPRESYCAPATGCDNPAPASAGEFCGSYRWCNRPCAAGLECTGSPTGTFVPQDYRRVCVPVGDGGADGAVRD